jgi:uncharacterized membrane-anchored protein
MMSKIHLILCGATFAIATSVTAVAQAEAPENAATEQPVEDDPMYKLIKSIDWKSGTEGSLGNLATLKVPENYRFTGTTGTVKLMEAFGNLTNGSELGYISPNDMSWFAVFEFDEVGYVKDDEKDNLDADKILAQLKEGQQQANQELSKRGMPTLQVLGWQTAPFYNPVTHNLEWAIRLHSNDGDVVNYKTKILGRRGVMDVVLVCGEEELPVVVDAYQKLLTGFSYKKEESYASFTSGDKIATYGLTGLIVGGGLLVAAKSGLLGKLIKPIIAGVLIVGVFLKRMFVGKTKESI